MHERFFFMFQQTLNECIQNYNNKNTAINWIAIQKKKMTYDDLLHKIGDFGKYQKRIYFFLCLPAISCALHKLAGVFILAKTDHR